MLRTSIRIARAIVACLLLAVVPRAARAEVQCTTVEAFNNQMAADGSFTTDATVTFELTGVSPPDYFGTKGSPVHFVDTSCATGAGAGIKVYGTADPPNTAHPAGTLKYEYGTSCCGLPTCPEGWADPNASEVIFVDGSEVCQVTAWVNRTDIGYHFVCGANVFDAVGPNDQALVVGRVHLLTFELPDGGFTWQMPNASATNVELCFAVNPTGQQSLTQSVQQDVTASTASPDTVYPDVNDLSVGMGDSETYLQFVLASVPGRITSARLLLRSASDTSAEGDGADVYVVVDQTWSETTLTWNNRPPSSGASLGRLGPVSPDQAYSVDVTAAVTGAGTYSFALVPAATDLNSAHFLSKEASAPNSPALRIQYEVVDADGDGTPDGPDCDDTDPTVHPGATEVCNGVDDNCDGVVDEGCPCTPSATRPCGLDVGDCVPGVETCEVGGQWGACVGATGPAAQETCGDGRDNDCDGVVDNGCNVTPTDGGPSPTDGGPGPGDVQTDCGGCASSSRGEATWPLFLLLALWVLGRRRRD